jgi:hypothetical protein
VSKPHQVASREANSLLVQDTVAGRLQLHGVPTTTTTAAWEPCKGRAHLLNRRLRSLQLAVVMCGDQRRAL